MVMYVLALLLTPVVLLLWWHRRPPRSAPGPRGFPVVGMLPYMYSMPHAKLQRWSRVYGPIMNVRVGREDWIVLSDMDVIKETMIKQGHSFGGRPPNYFTDVVLSGGRRGILFADGEIWLKQKRLVHTAFRKNGLGDKKLGCIITEEARCLSTRLLEVAGRPYDCRLAFMDFASNIMYNVLHGYRLDYNDEEFQIFSGFARLFTLDPERTKIANALIFCPALRFLPRFRQEVSTGNKNKVFAEEYLRSMLKKAGYKGSGLIATFLQELSDSNDKDLISEMHLIYFIRDMLVAGIETTTVTLLWCILAVGIYKDWQERIQTEIDGLVGDRDGIYGRRNQLPNTMAFIQEVHRYCSVVPLALPHYALTNAHIRDFPVSKGTTVITNLWAAHRDPKVFPKPNQFYPQRFITADKKFLRSSNVLPFSTGIRSCVGEQLATMETFICFVSILEQFSVSIENSNGTMSMDDGVLSTTHSPKTFKVVLNCRKKDGIR